MRKRAAATTFINKYYFICPKCKDSLYIEKRYVYCHNRYCTAFFSLKRVKYTCCQDGCSDMTAGICLANDNEWESRCEKHLDQKTTVKVGVLRKSKNIKHRNYMDPQQLSGKKTRVIKKGEFPGQHISY